MDFFFRGEGKSLRSDDGSHGDDDDFIPSFFVPSLVRANPEKGTRATSRRFAPKVTAVTLKRQLSGNRNENGNNSSAAAPAASASATAGGGDEGKEPATADENDENIQVIVRVRPFLHVSGSAPTAAVQYDEKDAIVWVEPPSSEPLNASAAKPIIPKLAFHHVFGSNSTNKQLYASVTPVINGFLQGINGTVMAYGMTGSGTEYGCYRMALLCCVRSIFANLLMVLNCFR